MKLVIAFLAGVLMAIGMSGRADNWLTGTVRSYHLERRDYEESNLGLGVETDVSQRIRLALGFYRNSERRDSFYGAAVYCPISTRYQNWRICGLAGGVTGYNEAIAPLAGAVLSYESREWGANLLILPNKRGDFTAGVVALQLKHRW